MTPDVLEMAIRRLSEADLLDGDLTILWHAGEPLAVPIEFYEQAFSLLRRCVPDAIAVNHRVVTNATLINKRWCDLFTKWDVGWVVSIDGPAALHDMRRVTRSGHGTHQLVMKGIQQLKSCDIDPNYLCVVGGHNVDHPQAVFRFFESLNATRVSFNIDELEGQNPTSTFEDEAAIDRLRLFFTTYMMLNFDSSHPHWVREFEEAAERIVLSTNSDCDSYLTTPFRIVTVGFDWLFFNFFTRTANLAASRMG